MTGDSKASAAAITTKPVFSGKGVVKISLVFVVVLVVSCLILYKATHSYQLFPSFFYYSNDPTENQNFLVKIDAALKSVLKNASTKDKTVIITTLNEAWAEPDSILDLFLQSFKIGDGTYKYVQNLVIICLDDKAYNRCVSIHPHCYSTVKTDYKEDLSGEEAYFMSPVYLEMMWKRLHLLSTILQMGYNFVFTDADIMWLRDPFKRFYDDADFQIACDSFNGNSYSTGNSPNGGFIYVKSNKRTIKFYKFWYLSRKEYPAGLNEQDILDKIKHAPLLHKMGLKMRFLSTAYIGGFCEPSKDLNQVCTMHANCCYGLENKIFDLKIVLQDWKTFNSSNPIQQSSYKWRVPQHCRAPYHPPEKKKAERQH